MFDEVALAPFAQHVLTQAEISGLPNHYRGKVRENYDLPDGRRVLIATDHSAYDYDFIVRNSKLVVDTRNATKDVKQGRDKIRKA